MKNIQKSIGEVVATRGRYGHWIKIIIMLIDMLCVNCAYFLVLLLLGGRISSSPGMIWLLVNLSYLPVILIFNSTYDERVVYIDRAMARTVKAIGIHIFSLIGLLFFIPEVQLPPQIVVAYALVLFVLLGIWRISSQKLLKKFRSKGYNFKRVIIVGAGYTGRELYAMLQSDLGYGYKVFGFFDDDEELGKSLEEYRGPLSGIEDFVKAEAIDEIYCALPPIEFKDEILSLLKYADSHIIPVFIVPEVSHYLRNRLFLRSIGNIPIFTLRKEPLSNPIRKFGKRLFDLVFSSLFLLVSPVLFIPIAIAVKMSSPGPVFFKQKRSGLLGKEFYCYKFRTMRQNKNSDLLQATKDDPRKTRVGDFLRRTSLDELPQFINVFKGDMSIVGPRPHMLKHTEDYSKIIDQYMLRLLIKPGITGWAQVNGFRGETRELWQMEKRVEFDIWYIENWNFWLDLKIIVLTVLNAFRGEKNAF